MHCANYKNHTAGTKPTIYLKYRHSWDFEVVMKVMKLEIREMFAIPFFFDLLLLYNHVVISFEKFESIWKHFIPSINWWTKSHLLVVLRDIMFRYNFYRKFWLPKICLIFGKMSDTCAIDENSFSKAPETFSYFNSFSSKHHWNLLQYNWRIVVCLTSPPIKSDLWTTNVTPTTNIYKDGKREKRKKRATIF